MIIYIEDAFGNSIEPANTIADFAWVDSDQEIHSSVIDAALVGDYRVDFKAGLQMETDAEIMTRTTV